MDKLSAPLDQNSMRRLSRRRFLKLAGSGIGLTVAGGVLAACGGPAEELLSAPAVLRGKTVHVSDAALVQTPSVKTLEWTPQSSLAFSRRNLELNGRRDRLSDLLLLEDGTTIPFPRFAEPALYLVAMGLGLGIESRTLDAKAVAALDPGITMEVEGAVYFPQDRHLTPERFVGEMQDRLGAMGVEFAWDTELVDWRIDGGTRVRSPDRWTRWAGTGGPRSTSRVPSRPRGSSARGSWTTTPSLPPCTRRTS